MLRLPNILVVIISSRSNIKQRLMYNPSLGELDLESMFAAK